MKIVRIAAYQCDLPLREGSYHWSGGKSVSLFDSTVVRIDTDNDASGWGEVCPLGPFYLPAFGQGARAGIYEIGPHLLGASPVEVKKINRRMDIVLKGHPYAKSAIDMACWDLFGKATGLPVCELLGGRFGENVKLYRAISQDSPEAMAEKVAAYREEGYRNFQLKVGCPDVSLDIARIRTAAEQLKEGDCLVADANTGWLKHEALRVCRGVRETDVYIEQPCASYEECRAVRDRWDGPFVLDENIDGLDPLLRGHADQAMDVVNIKISKFGGLTKTSQARDLCVDLGLAMTLEDSWGGDIVTAAIAHLAHSTPEELRFTSTDFNSYVTVQNATGAPQRKKGTMEASSKPGLGIEPILEELGDPLFVVE